jgi:hypothetical protein
MVKEAELCDVVYVIMDLNKGGVIEIRPLNEETIKRIKS